MSIPSSIKSSAASQLDGDLATADRVSRARKVGRKKNDLSAGGTPRIVAALKGRWATVNARRPLAAMAAAPKRKKRTISVAHRAKLAAVAKARRAGVKKGGWKGIRLRGDIRLEVQIELI